MSKSKHGRNVGVALCACVLQFCVVERVGPTLARAEAEHAQAAAIDADDLARAAADRFARAIDHADVAAATSECSLPHLNLFGDIAPDAASRKQSLEWFTEFARRHPEAGVYYRGITACVPFDDFRRALGNAPQDPKADRKRLANLDPLKLGASDRVVFVRWMYAYSILVRVRDGKATVAGLGPGLPEAAMKNLVAAARPYREVRDVVYGRTYGAALTLDVLTPIHGANGAAVLCIQSGDFVSQPLAESDNYVLEPFLLHGYTVITVVHGGFPKYTIAETIRHVERAVRFIRFHARDYAIDPHRIGVTGSSSGGYLALMLATAGAKEPPLADESDPVGKPDEIDAVSCRVQAAGCYFAPTDWLDYGAENKCVLDASFGPQLQAMFQFYEFDKRRFTFTPITDRARIVRVLADISPARRVTKETAPILLLHGENDPTVPLQQSQLMIERLKAAGVPAKLVIKPGAGHGWNGQDKDLDQVRLWFDTNLARRP
jgi:acetyl esterase/lipase